MQLKSAQYSANKWFRYKIKKLKNKNFNVIYKLYKYRYMKLHLFIPIFVKKT
jgi:hypothetical protein